MARLSKPPIKIPFKDGNMVEYYGGYGNHPSIELKDNFEFYDELEFVGFSYAHTGSKFQFKSKFDGKTYLMFPTEAQKAVPLMEKGLLKSKFTFVKKNLYFGIKMVE